MDSEEKTSLDCPVCLEQYDEGNRTPKMMPCLHTLCVSCVIELVTSAKTTTTTISANTTTISNITTTTNTSNTRTIPSNRTSFPIYMFTPLVRSEVRQAETVMPVFSSQEHNEQHLYEVPLHQDQDVPGSSSNSSISSNSSSSSSSSSDTMRPLYGNSASRPTSIQAIATFANLLQNNRAHPTLRRISGQLIIPRNPRDPLPSTPPVTRHSAVPSSPPALPARKPGIGVPSTPERPMKKANNPLLMPKPPKKVAKEPEVPRNQKVQCPLCRSPVNTSQLQTNRYVLAHLRDLVRLQALHRANPPPIIRPTLPTATTTSSPTTPTPQPSAPSFIPGNFWCISCDAPALDDCVTHELSPIQQWVGTLGTSVCDLQRRVEHHLNAYSTDLDDTDTDVKIVFQSLSKASRHLWKSRQDVQKVRDELSVLAQTPTSTDPRQHALSLSQTISGLRSLEERVAAMEVGVESNEVYIYRQNNKLYVCTCQPDRTIIITISEGQRQPDI